MLFYCSDYKIKTKKEPVKEFLAFSLQENLLSKFMRLITLFSNLLPY